MAAIHLTDKEDGVLLVAAKAGDNVVIAPDRISPARETSFYAVWSKDAMGGTLLIETAHHAGFPGQWQELGSIAWAESNSVKQSAIVGAFMAVRIRLIEDVVGGTITLYGIAN